MQYILWYNELTSLKLLERNDIMASVSVNLPAPDFKIDDFNGKPFQLSSFKGQKYILLVMNRGFV
jgi:cytochrome oxidase Cu insertion factor (SCO1/SenC/PrrC family)